MDITEQQIAGALNVELNPQEQPQAAETGGTDLAAADAQQEQAVTAGQSAEERHENAARRRRQEQQAAIDEAVQKALAERDAKAQQEKDALIKRMKLKNTVNGKPIETEQDYLDYERDFAEAKLNQKLKAGKLTKDELDELLQENPTVQEARKIVEQNAEDKRQKQNEAAKAKIDEELAAIHKVDPNINGIEDLANAPYSEQFKKYVERGFTFYEAFTLCNSDAIQTAAAEAARNSAMLNSRGKDHLTGGNNARGAGAVSVPAADMAMFKLFNPKATPEEIQAYYNKNRK